MEVLDTVELAKIERVIWHGSVGVLLGLVRRVAVGHWWKKGGDIGIQCVGNVKARRVDSGISTRARRVENGEACFAQ